MKESHKALKLAAILRNNNQHAAAATIETLLKERNELGHALENVVLFTKTVRSNSAAMANARSVLGKFNNDEEQ